MADIVIGDWVVPEEYRAKLKALLDAGLDAGEVADLLQFVATKKLEEKNSRDMEKREVYIEVRKINCRGGRGGQACPHYSYKLNGCIWGWSKMSCKKHMKRTGGAYAGTVRVKQKGVMSLGSLQKRIEELRGNWYK